MAVDSGKWIRIAGDTILLLAAIVLGLQHFGHLIPERPEHLARDFAVATGLSPQPIVDDVTVVTVDDASLLRLGTRWPLDRGEWAQLINAIAAHEPKAIAIDAWFEAPAPREDVELAMQLADDFRRGASANTPFGRRMIPKLDAFARGLDGDARFAEAIANAGNVILGAACVPAAFDTMREAPTAPPEPIEVAHPTGRLLTDCDRLSANITPLALAARGQGMLDIGKDSDGRARRYGYLKHHGEQTYPSLALEALRVGAGPEWTTRVQRLPSATSYMVPLPPKAFTTVRMMDLWEMERDDPVLARSLRGKLVFIGTSAVGTRDYMETPVVGPIPGVFLHATAAASALSNTWSIRPEWVRWFATFGGLALFVGLWFVGGPLTSLRGVVTLGVASVSIWLGITAYFLARGVWVPGTVVLVGTLGWMAAKVSGLYWSAVADRRKAAHIRRVFQQYLAPEVVAELIAHPEKLSLGGERRDITAFFADMQGFTSLSEKLEPDALAALLNRCLGVMSEIIVEEGGIIDKYVGDAIVAMFGAPIPHPDHAARAARAAARCQGAVDALGPWLAERSLPTIAVRIGLNSGPAVVGNMGSDHRFDYTMLGDAVNYAARLESANKMYGTRILLGESTAQAVEDEMVVRLLDEFQARGKTVKAPIFELIGPRAQETPDQKALCSAYAEALSALWADEIEIAHEGFSALAEAGDGPAKFHLERIEAGYGEGHSQM